MRNRKAGYGLCQGDNAYGCPVEATLDVIGGKWKGVILYHLTGGTVRFNEFRRLMPGITQRMLTLQLRELESDGLIRREVFQEIPPRVEYSLTELGRTLEEIILAMRAWGEKYQRLSARDGAAEDAGR
ncbi:winged helix-turn-helix transcriptional regulator [Paenibacillus caseinilyticus]|uniref:ArsR family transcriptional regulator n=1 Tax=Paenibacillus mucilaginosus K02 TaxID=997761 RepID=I0BHR7_9BACL|nr:helix-turn-helix domain-containing protein [Paenibacillus mucilaginosus]AFH61914.1 ArsR family transcriptional regulator [Paenibacillus mucilaginosus K02]